MAMATHNSRPYVERAIASINRSFEGSGRQFALIVADDASSDGTLSAVRRAPSSAAYQLTLGFKKASCVGESKNRASMMALPFLERFPWVLWMDDDDEMLPGRLRLIDEMEARGQKAGVGDWVHSLRGGDMVENIRGDWSIAHNAFSPCMTAIHRDLIPPDGRYFHHAPDDVHEDLVTHHLMALSGVPWCYHRGFDIHVYHRRDSSWSGDPTRTRQMLQNAMTYIRKFKSRTSIASFCTVAVGSGSVSEAVLMIRSLRLSGNDQPVYVVTDSAGSIQISGEEIDGVETVIDNSVDEKNLMFPAWGSHYKGTGLVPGAMLLKMVAIRRSLSNHPSTLYIDADQVVLRGIHDSISDHVGLSFEAPGSMESAVRACGWELRFFGCFNGGYGYFTRGALDLVDLWERDYLSNYDKSGRDDQHHGCFLDQACLDLFPSVRRVHAFHPGHNLSCRRLPMAKWPEYSGKPERLGEIGITGGHDLFFQGWPIVTIHQHFRSKAWDLGAKGIFTGALGASSSDVHASILGLINEGGPAPTQSLSTRPRTRYITKKT